MRASIIQLKEVHFRRIEVEVTEPPPGEPLAAAGGFDFDGVAFAVTLDIGSASADDDDATEFVVVLRVALDPEEAKRAPYRIDVEALALVRVAAQVEPNQRRDLALVNGASLAYGAIRELITTVTGRCLAGSLVLPTTDFRDHSTLLRPVAATDKHA